MEAIASLADLYLLDVRFVRLLERFALESMSFQESVALKGIAFVHLRFEVEFKRFQSRFDDQSYRGFLSLFRFYYFSQSLFIDKFDRMHLIRASLLAFGQPSVESLNDDRTTLSPSSLLEMNHYRFLLILGNRLSGKSSIAKQNAIEASIQYNSVLLLDGVDQSLIFYKSSSADSILVSPNRSQSKTHTSDDRQNRSNSSVGSLSSTYQCVEIGSEH
ncbi:MAG: hypothetical protein MZU97_25020 [Bacillus subtilis]|nr:hypothetical protein [Bacillus subtilis]